MITLNVESKIHSQPSVASEIGAAQGIRIRNRAIVLPRKRRMSARARMLPNAITRTCETNVKTKVFQSARLKTGLPTTARKFLNPTNETSRLPAEEFVRLRRTAATNGSATSRRMYASAGASMMAPSARSVRRNLFA